MDHYEKFGQFELSMDEVTKPLVKVIFFVTLISVTIQFLYNGFPTFTWKSFLVGFLLFIFYYVLLIFLHEICHLLGFLLFTRAKPSSLKLGIDLKKGFAYATTTQLMTNKGARKAIMLPLWLTGFLPLFIGIYFNHFPLVIVSPLLIAGALGDIMMYQKLRTLDDDVYVKDDEKAPILHFYKKTENPS